MNAVSKIFLSLAVSSLVLGLAHVPQAHAQSRPAVEVHPEALRGGNVQGGVIAQGGYALRPSTLLRMPGSNEMRTLPALQYPVAKRAPKPTKKKAPVMQEPTQEVAARTTVQEPVIADINESSQIVTQEETKLSSQVSAKRSPQAAARPQASPAPDVDFINPPAVEKRPAAKLGAKPATKNAAPVQTRAQTQAEPILMAEPDPDLMADIASESQASVAPKPRAAPKAATKTALAPPVGANSYAARPSTAAPSPSASKVAKAEPSADVSFTPPSASGGASVLFDATSSELSPAARKQLDALASQYSGVSTRLQVEAYAGAAGDRSSDARRLSLKRGLAVRSYLMSKGVSGARIDVRALGGAARGNTDRVDIHRQEG